MEIKFGCVHFNSNWTFKFQIQEFVLTFPESDSQAPSHTKSTESDSVGVRCFSKLSRKFPFTLKSENYC